MVVENTPRTKLESDYFGIVLSVHDGKITSIQRCIGNRYVGSRGRDVFAEPLPVTIPEAGDADSVRLAKWAARLSGCDERTKNIIVVANLEKMQLWSITTVTDSAAGSNGVEFYRSLVHTLTKKDPDWEMDRERNWLNEFNSWRVIDGIDKFARQRTWQNNYISHV